MSQKRRIYPQPDSILNSNIPATTTVQNTGQSPLYLPTQPQPPLFVSHSVTQAGAVGNTQIETISSRMNDLSLNQTSTTDKTMLSSPPSTSTTLSTPSAPLSSSLTSTPSLPSVSLSQITPSPPLPTQVATPDVNVMFTSEVQAPRQFIRMTVNAIPKTMELQTKSGIPLGCVIHPLAEDKQVTECPTLVKYYYLVCPLHTRSLSHSLSSL
jgi:hypothetical protein